MSQLTKTVEKLAQYAQWVGWAYVPDETGKMKKPPFNPSTGHEAKPNDPTTWGTYQQAINAIDHFGFEGVGFMFYPPNINVVGIDIDDCIDETGNISKFGREVIEAIPGYWEFSPSGKGLHALVLGSFPPKGRRKDDLGIEMYETGRYFTVTGNQLPSSIDDLVDCTHELHELHAMIFGQGTAAKPIASKTPQVASSLSDDEIIDKAKNAKSGAKFKTLWGGDISGYGNDHSRADFALCSMLAYWTDSDESTMDRLFRRSGLMRDKWDEMHGEGMTYGQMTLERAIQGSQSYTQTPFNVQIGGKNTPIQINRKQDVNTVGGVKLVGEGGKEYSLNTDEEKSYLLYGENASDDGNARCVMEWYGKKYGGHFLYTNHYGWFFWTGSHWKNEDAELRVMRAVLDTILERRKVAVEKESEKMVKAFKPTTSLVNSTVGLLKILSNANILEFDNDPDSLNCKNGVVNLRTGSLTPHHPSQRFTYCVPVDYDPNADYTEWLNHIYKTFVPEDMLIEKVGKLELVEEFPNIDATSIKEYNKLLTNYKELIIYIQTALGYTLTGRPNEEIMFYVWGETRSGKGTLFHAVSTLLGKPFAMTAMLSSLTRKRTGDGQNFDLAPLKPARLVMVSETDNSSRSTLNEATIKGMTGQDPIRCCMKGKDHFEYVPVFKIWMASNYGIKANADDHAMWQRVKVLYTPNSFAGREDTQLKNRLMSAKNLQGVLAWLVQGARIWYHYYDKGQKLPTPELVTHATNMARNENDVLGLFIEECCTTGVDKDKGVPYRVPVLAFAKAYTEWCTENMYVPKMARALNEAMRRKGFVYKSARAGDDEIITKCWEGIIINTTKLEY